MVGQAGDGTVCVILILIVCVLLVLLFLQLVGGL